MVEFRLVTFDAQRVVDSATFHDEFAEQLGFPDVYGSNWDAWIDCMTHLELGQHIKWLLCDSSVATTGFCDSDEAPNSAIVADWADHHP